MSDICLNTLIFYNFLKEFKEFLEELHCKWYIIYNEKNESEREREKYFFTNYLTLHEIVQKIRSYR